VERIQDQVFGNLVEKVNTKKIELPPYLAEEINVIQWSIKREKTDDI